MTKRIVAALVLFLLVGMTVYTFLEGKNTASDDSASKGTAIVPADAPEGVQKGDIAPNVSLQTLDGETIRLSDFKGEKVFLNFWASWCAPCLKEMPEMQQFHEEFGDDVTILAVNATGTEKSEAIVKEFVEEGGYTFPIALDVSMDANTIFRAQALPTTYFIGSDGVIQQPAKFGAMSYEFMVEMKDKLQ
ncbi:TlpA disulfide reductase family protein [Pontibacillus litoralis]|uniref:Thioredoxin domain-containing protein n=1 Tax=Pontibacillus litoralis JSM 072002 TaxID=1385512 RepID=A0A0A5HVB5_9BACI|nr:TlpA disulfide reductase family protein [Pontibacillus litoralis]KGX87557.1 hypothetical protein N784_15025 [Pontibacillus litoralis JSM 072002]